MLRWALYFFIVSLVAALLGFTDIAGPAAAMARIFFWLFIVISLVTVFASIAVSRRQAQ
jgi:uncharacterized membrane protein YtjA (UPF0391 family)